MADKRIDQLVAATTLGNNDLLVLEQNNQAKKMSGATLASFVYNAAANKIDEVNQAVADAQDAVDSLEEQKNTIAEAIASMADLGTDTTLSTTGMAADAKATGDRIDAIRDAIADREDSGVASKNYATGSFILIGDALYETAGPITTGESLVPGSNCTATTVAAQIAYIKSIINGLGNLAYLSYENA